MKLPRLLWSLSLLACVASSSMARLFILTDLENKPDDAQSMVRLVAYATPSITEDSSEPTASRPGATSAAKSSTGVSRVDASLANNEWPSQGPLGAQYLPVVCLMDGDTTRFLSLVFNGLDTPGKLNFGGWNGRYEFLITFA